MAENESVPITTTIDAAKNWYFDVIDAPGEFLMADQYEEVIVIL